MEALTLPAPTAALVIGMQCSHLPAFAAQPSAPACAALAMAAAPPPALMLPQAAEASASCDGSLESCSSDLAEPMAVHRAQQAAGPTPQQSCDCMDPALRTHHLLKHCLSQSQRGAALQQFHTMDPREAAKEIARMGQRELQAKFKEVYGSATKSNNNSWLRRKLYEAVGVAPLKASTKGKARKASSASAARKAGGHGSRDGKGRPTKVAAPKARRPSAESPASPQGGMSIFGYSEMVSAGTTASDSEDGCGSHAALPASLHTSAPGTPRSSLGLPFAASTLFDGQPRQQLHDLAPPAVFVPLPGMPAPEPQSPQASGLHWADGLSPAQQPPAAAPFLSAASRTLSLDPAADGLSSLPGGSAFKPMELEQDAWDAADVSTQPWYFGSSLDLAVLGPATLPMQCGSSAACDDDDDDIPLLTLDLGAIDVSI